MPIERNASSFCNVGQALFGDAWPASMARALNVNIRKVERWAAGAPMPPGVWTDLEHLCEQRGDILGCWASDLRAANA